MKGVHLTMLDLEEFWKPKKKHPDNSAGDLFGMVKCPFQRLSDLQLGDDRVTLNDLDLM